MKKYYIIGQGNLVMHKLFLFTVFRLHNAAKQRLLNNVAPRITGPRITLSFYIPTLSLVRKFCLGAW